MSGIRRPLVRPILFAAAFETLGRRFELRSNIPGSQVTLARILAPFRAAPPLETSGSVYELLELLPGGGEEKPFELFLDGWSINRSRSLGGLVDWIVSDITREAIEAADGYAVVHASAAAREQRAIMLPAPPEHGKTTTIAALARAGWDFLTDEAALISLDTGLIHPFPRPLMISPTSMGVLPGLKEGLPRSYEPFRHFDFHVAPDDLRMGCLSEPVPVRFVVFPEYGDGAATALTQIPRAEALIELFSGCFNMPRLGPNGPKVLGDVVRGAGCYRLSIGAIEPAVELIQALFDEPFAEVAAV